MDTRRCLLLASLCCASCAALEGRTVSDASVDASLDARIDAAAPADSTLASDAIDRPVPAGDAAVCPRGAFPSIDSRQFGVVVESAPHPFAGAVVRSAMIDAEGRVYAVGYTAAGSAVWRFHAASLALDDTWGAQGVAADPTPSTATSSYWLVGVIDEEGRAVVGGCIGDDTRASGVVARFTVNGHLDETFGTSGRLVVPPGRVPSGSNAVRPFGMWLDADGLVVAAADSPPWDRPSQHGIAFKLLASGGLDEAFGTVGVFADARLHGCFDVKRDGDGYMFACISESDRPALLRLDRSGQRTQGFGTDGVSVHASAPRGFQVRSLQRDSAGRWLVAGSISPFYSDASSPPAAVRFLPGGAPDLDYGEHGTALAPGVRQTFAYAFGQSVRLGCDDRLWFGAGEAQLPLVGAFDRNGHRLTDFGEDGYLRGPTRNNTFVVVSALLPAPRSADLVLVGNTSAGGAAFARLMQ